LPVLALGGVGVVSVTSHVAGRDLATMHDSWFAGDISCAQKIHLRSLALTRAMFVTSNPVPVKHALKLMGVIPCDYVRLPLVGATIEESEIIQASLKNYGIL
jgi:4-hydroxy-tetrahydrodipicolinate synthase